MASYRGDHGDAVRDVERADLSQIVALNSANVEQTSPLDLATLEELWSLAELSKAFVLNRSVQGFVFALREKALHSSVNFLWFKERYPRFLYIDRVVVAQAHRQKGVASRLYDELENAARGTGVPMIACEVNELPPNPTSLSFHTRRGFVDVGRVELTGKTKIVSMLVKHLG